MSRMPYLTEERYDFELFYFAKAISIIQIIRASSQETQVSRSWSILSVIS